MFTKKAITLALIALVACNAQFQVTLKSTDVNQQGGNGFFADSIVYFTPTVGETAGVWTIFDTTANENYQITGLAPAQSPTSFPSAQGLGAANGNLFQTAAKATVVNSAVNFGGDYSINNVAFEQVQVSPKSVYAGQSVEYGLGLNLPSNVQAANLISASASTDSQISKFSFFLWKGVKLAIFGEPEKFFTKNDFKKVNVLDPTTLQGAATTTVWAFSILGVNVDGTSVASKVAAQIDTTTEFITVDSDTYNAITAQLSNIVQSVNGDTVNQYADSAEVDNLKQKINFQLDTAGTNDFSIDAKDLFRKVNGNDARQIFLVRRGAKATGTALWTLGRTFLSSVYTSFEVGKVGKSNTLSFATANDFKVQSIVLNQTKRAWLIALGVTLFAVSVLVVLRLLKPLGNVPPTQPKTSPKQSVKLVPTTQVVYQAQPAYFQAQPLVLTQIPATQGTTTQTFPPFRPQGSPARINAQFPGGQQSGFPRQQ